MMDNVLKADLQPDPNRFLPRLRLRGRLGFEIFDLVPVTQLSKDHKLETLERGQALCQIDVSYIFRNLQ